MRKISPEHTKEIKERILNATKDSLVQDGYRRTTIRHIVERSGVLTGSIYYFYRNKEEIFQDLFRNIIRECIERIEACCADETPAFRYAAVCETELKTLSEDKNIREIYYQCYNSPLIFETFVQAFARLAKREFGDAFTNDEYYRKALLLKGAMHGCLAEMYFDHPVDLVASRKDITCAVLVLFKVSDDEIKATIQRMQQKGDLWKHIASELINIPLAF